MEKTKAACYVRTSTDREEQEGSFALQKEYFINMITNDPNLEFDVRNNLSDRGDRGCEP